MCDISLKLLFSFEEHRKSKIKTNQKKVKCSVLKWPRESIVNILVYCLLFKFFYGKIDHNRERTYEHFKEL